MNAKEAGKLVSSYEAGRKDRSYFTIDMAKGYLAALEGPEVSALVKALEDCAKWYRFKGQDGASDANGLDGLRLAQGVAEKALAEFKGEKL